MASSGVRRKPGDCGRRLRGERPLAWFELGGKEKKDPAKAAGVLVQLKQAGKKVDDALASEMLGFEVEEAPEAAPAAGGMGAGLGGGFGGGGFGNRAEEFAAALRNRAGEYVAGKKAVRLDGKFFDFLEHLANKYGGKAEADEEWLDQIAGMIEEAPPESFVDSAALESWIEARMRRGEREGLKNSRDANGVLHGDEDGKFAKDGGGAPKESAKARKKRELKEKQDADIKKGASNMATVKAGKDCPDFMPGVRNSNVNVDHIGFYQGDNSQGYLHILNHGPDDNGVYNHQPMLEGDKIPHTIAKGTWYKHHDKIVAVDRDRCVAMVPDGKGLRIHTAYESASHAAAIRNGGFKRLYNREESEDAE